MKLSRRALLFIAAAIVLAVLAMAALVAYDTRPPWHGPMR